MRAVFSMKVPVPPLHADCMNTCLPFPERLAVKKIVFMSSPPISETKDTSGWSRSTDAATATTSWTSLPPTRGAMNPAPEPVKKTRSRPAAKAALGLHPGQEVEDGLRLAGVVPLVVLPERAAVLRPPPP